MVPLDIEHQTNNLLQHSLGIIHAQNNMSVGLMQMSAQTFKVPCILAITYSSFQTDQCNLQAQGLFFKHS
jgi:hypothetical protein